MKLDFRQKQTLYHELGQFLRSGIPLPQAVEALAQDTRSGPLQKVLTRLSRLFLGGESVPGAFAQLQPAVGSMEIALVEAANLSGRLEQAFAYLSNYFGSMYTVRSSIIRQSVWPLTQLHLGVFVFSAAGQLLATGGLDGSLFAWQCGKVLGAMYLAAALVWGGCVLLAKGARTNPKIDYALNFLPLIGRLRRNMALSRFCATYEMQVQAGINVMDGLRTAADASQSARIRTAVAGMIPQVRAGSSLGPLFAGQHVFPNALQRAVRVGEETGGLDEDLHRWADYYQKAAIAALETLGAWVPRIIFFLIALYVGYGVIAFYTARAQGFEKILNGDF